MNYKLLFEIELEKNKQLEDKIIVKDIEIKKLKSTIETQEHHIGVLNDREPEIKYVYRDSMVYA